METNITLDECINNDDSNLPAFLNKVTVVTLSDSEKNTSVYRCGTLTDYQLSRYVLENCPKPITRFLPPI